MNLITILALAFVAPSAMAERFGTSLDMTNDISSADGLQLALPDNAVNLTVIFQRAVVLEDGEISVGGFDEKDNYIPEVALAATDPITPTTASREITLTVAITAATVKVRLRIAGGIESDNPFNDDTSEALETDIFLLAADKGAPQVHFIRRMDFPFFPVVATTVEVVIALSEKPRAFTKDHVSVSNAIYGDPVALEPYLETVDMLSTGSSDKLYPYILTLTPKYPAGKLDLVVKVKTFADLVYPIPKWYIPPTTETGYSEGVDKLTIAVGKELPTTGIEVVLGADIIIPGRGYLVITKDNTGSAIRVPDALVGVDHEPKRHQRSRSELLYNVVDVDLRNLETFLAEGGVIDVVSPHPLIISEVMWGSDASLDDPSKSQWIEVYNAGAQYKTVDDDPTTAATEGTKLVFYRANKALPNARLTGVTDRIGTINEAGIPWSIAGKGRSGRSDINHSLGPQPITSMYRVIDATGRASDGRMASSWMASTRPSLNFELNQAGNRIGSPGAARIIPPAEAAATAAAEKEKADAAAAAAKKAEADAAAAAIAADTSIVIPEDGRIYISEIMFVRNDTLPQWIEIANGSWTEQVNLSRWTLTVENATADADVSVGTNATFTIPDGTTIDPSGQHATPSTILVVTERGYTNLDGTLAAAQIVNLWTDQRSELIHHGVTRRQYSLLSDIAFQITLAPPIARIAGSARQAALARRQATDIVGNLGPDGTPAWALPVTEGDARSSILRRHTQVPAAPFDGDLAKSWVLASDTSFAQPTHTHGNGYYGSVNDVGTPGFRAGGALPVELSHFRPARDKVTGTVVITWSTQSELNNAGFFIKRSQQQDGEFKVINPTMIPGAGTTSEKQSYTYRDTTAQPTVIYYYQIEDVSFDGNRQTLTSGTRLKGHIGAAGKLTTTWGDLKTQAR